MIFAAGLGTRLYPLTQNQPKALAPFLNSTLLAYNLLFLKQQGIDEFVINTHHFAAQIEAYLSDNNNFGCDIKISYEPILLDTAGGIAQAYQLMDKAEDVLLFNVDVISNIDVQAMYRQYKTEDSKACMAVRKRPSGRQLLFHKLKLNGWRNQKTNEEIIVNPDFTDLTEYAFSGIHWINRSLIQQIPHEKHSIIPFYLEAAKHSKITAYVHDSDFWFDCGELNKLKQAADYVSNI